MLLKINLENKAMQDGQQLGKDEQHFEIVLKEVDELLNLPEKDIINVVGVEQFTAIAQQLSLAMKTKVEMSTEEYLTYQKRLEIVEKILNLYRNQPPPIGQELFAMELHYDDGNPDLDAPPQYNGNISWVKWRVNTNSTRLNQAYGFQYDQLNRLTNATYGEYELACKNLVNKDRFNESIIYADARGNISNIQRTGLVGGNTYALIDNLMMTYNGNQLNTVAEMGVQDKGFKGTNGNLTYDARGNLITDASRGLTISYNYLDLPTQITVANRGNIVFLYDANGNLLTKTVNATAQSAQKTDYVKGFEYQNDQLQSIYHDEGRLVRVGGVWQSEYVLKDHLGNARVMFRDGDNNGSISAHEVMQEAHYYPFGMRMESAEFSATMLGAIPYLYNGIEHISDLGLDINVALYRTLDASLCRWWQVDPKGEMLMPLSPYCAMNNNPVIASDPNGDFVLETALVCAALGAMINLNVQQAKGKLNSTGDVLRALGGGALNGFMIGAGAATLGQGVMNLAMSAVNSFLPSVDIQGENFNLSISPMIGFGTSGFNLGASISASGKIGDFAWGLSASGGFNSGMSSLGESAGGSWFGNVGGFAGYNDGHANYGIGLSSNFFSGKTAQQVGAITLQIGDFGLRIDEDFFPVISDGGDRYRTGGLLATYKVNEDVTLAFGGSMITGQPGDRDFGGNPNSPDGKGMYCSEGELHCNIRGGTMFGGVVYKGQSYFAGDNRETRLQKNQRGIHSKMTTPYFTDMKLGQRFYSYFGSYHPNYLFY